MADDQDKFTDSDPDAETLESSPEQTRGGMPREIGQYKVRRVIGSGGMGTVYEAIQESPRRKVAIKVMRSGVTSRSAMRRFEYESQILGRLSHPCIAQVYEAGTHDDGSGGVPYFAMEYIVGARTLLDYAEKKNLTIHQKLELFEQVCDAVHHGHLKGIIHRDLKPDNILVDSSGNPKIIDFGVARSTDSDMVVTTLQTNVGQLIGTVQYMSPEQCEADPDLIDARSDVYSLGVILYELLTGQPPYNLSSIPIYEATRLIREQQPTKMTTIAEGIQGDLETIVTKAMDKDRDRRYQSSYELGQDITRYLENEPIHARRASMVYQLKMFARRNRGIVLGLTTIAIVLVLATVVSVYGVIRASKAEALAIIERDRAVVAEGLIKKKHEEAVAAKLEAEQAKNKLEASIQEVKQSASLLLELASFTEDLLSLGAPRNAQGKMLTTHDIALVATKEINKRFADIPHLEFPSRRAI
ncbi:MAG: serine/threonine-protein kinase, partial [Phycisphaerales bacterium]|nr:serine/threonine-protein kinase [Phycisphaerales bacterium]